jgi:uncharacterized membrane protein
LQHPIIRKGITWSAAAFYLFAGLSHFLHTASYVKIVPPDVPYPLAMVYLSGLAEIAGGAGLLIKSLRRPAAFGLIALLIAVFPANVYMAVHHIQVTSRPIPDWLLYLRLPFQLLFILWLWLIARKARPNLIQSTHAASSTHQ